MLALLITILRVLVGVLVMKTGVDLARGEYLLMGYSPHEPLLTGIFIFLLGLHIVFSSLFSR